MTVVIPTTTLHATPHRTATTHVPQGAAPSATTAVAVSTMERPMPSTFATATADLSADAELCAAETTMNLDNNNN